MFRQTNKYAKETKKIMPLNAYEQYKCDDAENERNVTMLYERNSWM